MIKQCSEGREGDTDIGKVGWRCKGEGIRGELIREAKRS